MNLLTGVLLFLLSSTLGFFAPHTLQTSPFLGNGTGTINQLSQWITVGGAVKLASTTADLRIPSLANETCIGTDADGDLQTGTCGGGGGSGNVATSSAETATYVPFWTSTGATPATLSGGENTFAYDATLNKLTIANASSTQLTASDRAYLGTTTIGRNQRLSLESSMDAQDGENSSLELKYRNDLVQTAKANISFESSTSTKAWIAVHDWLTASQYHGHLSFETKKASNDELHTRLEIEHSCDLCDIEISSSTLILGNDLVFRIGTEADGVKFSHDTTLARFIASSTLPWQIASTTGIKIGGVGAPAALMHVERQSDAVAMKLDSQIAGANGSALLLLESGAAGGTAIQSLVDGDSVNRFSMNTSGAMQWGSGAGTRDLGISRLSAGLLAIGTGASGSTAGGIITTNASTTALSAQTAAIGGTGTTSITALGEVVAPNGSGTDPSLVVGGLAGGPGLYRISASSLGISNGANGITWDGTNFNPNSADLRNLGTPALRWLGFHTVNSSSTASSATTAAFGGTATTSISATGVITTPQIDLVATGVRATAADGVLTLLGIGNGNDENLTIDFDNATADTVTIASGTSVATTTFSMGVAATRFNGTTASSSLAGLRITSGGLQISTLASCNTLDTDASGNVICGADAEGAGGGSDFTFSTHFGAITAATSSPMLFTGNLFASSTAAFGAKVGIGTTTPWGALSIASSTMTNGNYLTPLFVISTSSSQFGRLVEVYATTTTLAQRGANGTHDSGVRMVIGGMNGGHYNMANSYLDQLEVNGRINTMEWVLADCSAMFLAANAVASDAANACGQWAFGEDTNGSWGSDSTANGVLFGTLSVATALTNDGAGLFFGNGLSAGSLSIATSTPVIEAIARINNAEATTTTFVVGFANRGLTSSTYETEPSAGCFFLATSSTPNWLAVCRTALTTSTQVNTGFASSTTLTGNGNFYRFRVEADNNHARFFIGSSTAPLRVVADISTNYPSTNALAGQISFGRTAATLLQGWNVVSIRGWARQNILPQ